MIRHIAMFKFKAFESEKEKNNFFNRLKEAFDGLGNKIPEIKTIQIGFDILHTEASYDFVVNVEVENLEALPKYANHPDHIKAVAVIKEMAVDRKVIDYEF
ncbi:Dabb family protein [Ancylomarina longa]|uniref:Dabb family protein n=1 Tax=Ancylomarina longa TaxID=2487017 RepID=A0A434AFS2_9BACT|nr:Dabb family protein [Ancylomarina longa]RUT73202.1 Dabb family protein [Ancylomarina longa]